MIKKIIQPDGTNNCEGCVYEGKPECWIAQGSQGDTEECIEFRDIEPDIYYIYVEDEVAHLNFTGVYVR